MKKTTWLLASLFLLTLAGESNSQNAFVSPHESAALFGLAYETGAEGAKSGVVTGGTTLTEWIDAQAFLSVSDPGSYANTLCALGLGLRPFVRVAEDDKISLLLGLPVSFEAYSMTRGGAGSAFGTFGSVGADLNIAVRTGEVSRLVFSVGGSYADYLGGEIDIHGGISAVDAGVEQSLRLGSGSLLLLGFGASFVEDNDDAILLFELGFLFPKPRIASGARCPGTCAGFW